MKLFGKALLEKKQAPKRKSMYDFAQHGVLNNPEFQEFNANNYVVWTTSSVTGTGGTASQVPSVNMTKVEKPKKGKSKKNITPKELYNLQVLNQADMAIECGADYVKENVSVLKDKLRLLDRSSDSGATGYAKQELESLIERLENRRRFSEFKKITNEYPHTTSEAIGSILNKEEHLKCKPAGEFIPDFPKEAIDAMKDYTDFCQKLCNKEPVFYVIADKKDFGVIDKKRDPILLAQSPFGFFWQILGAWDEEMVFLGSL